jgi:tetratricopeptide (TPR) repeat protein
MNSRLELVMRIAIGAVVVGILIIGGLFVRYLIVSGGEQTPRTELERAIVAAEEAVRANPENSNARIKLAAAYLESGAVSAAIEQAQIATRLAPTDPSGFYVLGLAYAKQGDDAKTVVTLTKAANMEGQLAGFYQDVWAALAKAYERDDQDEKAIEAMNKALNFGPENSILLAERGSIYEGQKKWADALYDYAQAAQYSPDYEPAVSAVKRISSEHPEAVAEVQKRFEVTLPSVEATGSAATTTAP